MRIPETRNVMALRPNNSSGILGGVTIQVMKSRLLVLEKEQARMEARLQRLEQQLADSDSSFEPSTTEDTEEMMEDTTEKDTVPIGTFSCNWNDITISDHPEIKGYDPSKYCNTCKSSIPSTNVCEECNPIQ